MYSGVPMSVPSSVYSVRLGQAWAVALAMPKSMIFGTRLAVLDGDQDVRGLEVPVDDRLLVGVLDPVADLHEELQPLRGRQPVPVAVAR